MDTIIYFYTPKHYFLDNFSAFSIVYQDTLWPTVEHAYQAAKFDDITIIERIQKAGSPSEAKDIAHEGDVIPLIRLHWEDEKIDVMRNLLRQKVIQHPKVRKKLLETGEVMIVENSPTDSFWGCGLDKKGENWLGKLWVEIRSEIQGDKL